MANDLSELTRIRKELGRIYDKLEGFVEIGVGSQPTLEKVFDVDGNTVDFGSELIGLEVAAIAGETSAGAIVYTTDLWSKVAAVNGGTFTDKYVLTFGAKTTFFGSGRFATPLLTSDADSIELNDGHDLVRLHVYYCDPTASPTNPTVMKPFTDTYDLTANTPLTVAHNTGYRARMVTFIDSDGNEVFMSWSVDPDNPTTQIIIEANVDMTNLRVNIICF